MKILNFFKQKSNFLRYYSQICQQTYKTETFCNVKINVPFNITVKPLDVHKHPECNLIKIKLLGQNVDSNSINYQRTGNDVKIFAEMQENSKIQACDIEIPIKANLDVTSHGDITTGFLNGSELVLTSKNGDIVVGKYQGDTVDITTINGNINFNNSIEAVHLQANILEIGSIVAQRLLALNLDFQTKNGNITLTSSYCDNARFSIKKGNMTLQNLHKSSCISIEKGNLKLAGLDGSVDLAIGEGNADIHISRILENSKIDLQKGGLLLKISENCENTAFRIVGKEINTNQIPTSLKSSIIDDVLYLTPLVDDSTKSHQVQINCNDFVDIKTATWSDIFKLK